MDQDQARQQLAELLAEYRKRDASYSLSRFGEDLARIAGRPTPYTKQYLAAVLKGSKGFLASAELIDAIQRAALVLDGVSQFQASLRSVPSGVLSTSDIPSGAVVMGEPRTCQTPGCGLVFVGPSNRRYCPRCRPPKKHK